MKIVIKKLRKLAIILSLALGLVSQPATAFAQYSQVQLNYQLTPQTLNTTLTTNAKMVTSSDPQTTYSDINCVEVGTVDPNKGCTSALNIAIIKAAQDIYNAYTACAPNHGIELTTQEILAAQKDAGGGDCFYKSLKAADPKYTNDSINYIETHAIQNASANVCYQCVAFVEDALNLVGDAKGVVWHYGSQGYDVLPNSDYIRVTSGPAQPGDIFSYGTGGGAGHIGIVKEADTINPGQDTAYFTALDANADDRDHGGVTAGSGGTCDLSDAHRLPYKIGDISGVQARFIRKKGTPTPAGSSSALVQQIQDQFHVTMDGYDDPKILQWAYDEFSKIQKTNLLPLAEGGSMPGFVYIQNPKSDTSGRSPGYDITKGWSYTPGCSGKGVHNDPHLWLVDYWPRAGSSDAEQQEYFNITLTHEIGHIPQYCNSAGQGSQLEAIFDPIPGSGSSDNLAGNGAFSYYSQHGGDASLGCPTGVKRMNEDYADTIAYYLNPDVNQKFVCDAQKQRSVNPYKDTSTDPTVIQKHLDFAQGLLGQYP